MKGLQASRYVCFHTLYFKEAGLNAQLQTSINTVTVDYSDLMQTSEKITGFSCEIKRVQSIAGRSPNNALAANSFHATAIIMAIIVQSSQLFL